MAEPARHNPGPESWQPLPGRRRGGITARKPMEGEAEPRREALARERRSPGREGRNLYMRGCVRVGTGIKCAVEPGKECQRQLCKIAQASGQGRMLCEGNSGDRETWRWSGEARASQLSPPNPLSTDLLGLGLLPAPWFPPFPS